MICTSCGYDNVEDGKFCSQCGLPLASNSENVGDVSAGEAPDNQASVQTDEPVTGQANDLVDKSPKRPTAPAGMVSWDKEFPTVQITAVMPDVSQDAEEVTSNEVDDKESDKPLEDFALEKTDQTGNLPDSDAGTVPASEKSEEENQGAEEANTSEVCEDFEEKEPGTGDSEVISGDNSGDDIEGTADDTDAEDAEDLAVAEDISDAADVTDACDECASDLDDSSDADTAGGEGCENDEGDEDSGSIDEGGADNNDASDASVEDKDEDSAENADSADDEDDYMPVGKHAKPIDRAAATVKMDRVPESGPGSTAVIPSISVSGPMRYSDSDRDKADAQKKMSVKTMAIIAVLATVAIIAIFFGIRACVSGVTVPDVVNVSTHEARARLDAAGFEVKVESKVTDEAEDGTVLACEPKCGTKQRKGSTVTLTVAASQTVPDVVGMDLDSARNMLEEQGAKNIKVEAQESNQPENTVIAVSPDIGKPFSPDDEITLTVATSAYLPDVVGSDQEVAKNTLTEAGYEPEIQWIESDKPAGIVIASDPEPNSLANLGSTVTLTVASSGPSNFMHIMEYFNVSSPGLSEYLKWKGFSVSGSYTYTDEWSGTEYVSQVWGSSDKCTVSFTPAPYIEDKGLDPVDYMAEDKPFQAVRIFIPASSKLSLGTELTMSNVKKYMDACGLQNLSDSCTKADMEYNGKSGKEMGIDEFVCGQGEMNGMVWSILITEEGTYIGAGGFECYADMNPIADSVAVNEIFSGKKDQ